MRILFLKVRLTPRKSYQKVYKKTPDGLLRPVIVTQSWGDYLISAVKNKVRFYIKYGRRI